MLISTICCSMSRAASSCRIGTARSSIGWSPPWSSCCLRRIRAASWWSGTMGRNRRSISAAIPNSPFSHPLRRLLCRLRARGPPAARGPSALPGLQPDARQIQETISAPRSSEHISNDQPTPARMGGGRVGSRSWSSRWTINTPRTVCLGRAERRGSCQGDGPCGGCTTGGLQGLSGSVDLPGIGFGGGVRRRTWYTRETWLDEYAGR